MQDASPVGENILIKDKHIFLCIDDQIKQLDTIYQQELEFIKANFCGMVCTSLTDIQPDAIIYLSGDIASISIPSGHTVYVTKELSYNIPADSNVIGIGEVPINIHNVGVYFRKLFSEDNYFNLIKDQHEFQSLTESNKAGKAFRKGIYLTDVKQLDDAISFNLLRCSTNLSGPTDNFRDIDHQIIDKVNAVSAPLFESPIQFNHVLAQIYENNVVGNKQKKAGIKAHSDKKKDMPPNALIAFTTFYDNVVPSKSDLFDICYKNVSVLTCLRFCLKSEVTDSTLVKEFNVTLYPNSVFIIPLSTNRLYTHEIKPSILPVDKIPTRLGYVIRCSDTKAVFKDGQTFIDRNGELAKLNPITADDISMIRKLYYAENVTTDVVNYGVINCSMNSGDYKMPIV